ncbi:hypothetical protein [Streptobacillus moniliformis]|uniref:hypothetical protein n=1 Tax=Streptobacillus moniliformis TaxID=34105 RepID=UPI0007E39445|nr:hypothetical protein [Streptobacillus moniliformis]
MERLDEKNISIFSLLKYEKVKIFIGILLGIFSGGLSFIPYVILYQMILSLIGKTLNIHIKVIAIKNTKMVMTLSKRNLISKKKKP